MEETSGLNRSDELRIKKLEERVEKINYKLEQYRQVILWKNLLNSSTTQKTSTHENT
jgi:hypothetical protein